MTIWLWIAGVFCFGTTALHVASHLIVIRRCRAAAPFIGAPDLAECGPGISIVRPVCGIDNYVDETLRSAFQLDYRRYEIVFCVAHANDPVVPIVQRLIADHPRVPARLLIGKESIGDNPKLNNVYKGWRAAEHDWIVMADSNVLMPRDYLQRLLAAWRADTGLVASPPIGCRTDGFWAELECAFLNTYQARWQLTADGVGFGFAQGKSMLYRRSLLEQAGGIRALASEPAEDAATTKVVRGAGLRVRLVDAPFEQPLGDRRARDVWRRQLRWARLRSASFKACYCVEIFAGGVMPLAAATGMTAALGLPLIAVVALAGVWYGIEAMLAHVAGWHLSWRSPAAWVVRDLLLPVIWIGGWLGSGVVWRGHHVQAVESRSAV
jgi:ceramide glucosyltransferase